MTKQQKRQQVKILRNYAAIFAEQADECRLPGYSTNTPGVSRHDAIRITQDRTAEWMEAAAELEAEL